MLKKLMMFISGAVTFKPNMNSISDRIGISLNNMKNYLKLLIAEFLHLLYFENIGVNSFGKPEKIYLHNSNLMFNLVQNADEGNVRETFFFNQVSQTSTAVAAANVDFKVAKECYFELGSKNKKQKQIKNIPYSYIVTDSIEIGCDLNIYRYACLVFCIKFPNIS